MFTATQDFSTTLRRFKSGDPIAPVDCASMAQFERFREMGLIGEAPETQPPAPVPKMRTADGEPIEHT